MNNIIILPLSSMIYIVCEIGEKYFNIYSWNGKSYDIYTRDIPYCGLITSIIYENSNLICSTSNGIYIYSLKLVYKYLYMCYYIEIEA